MGARIENTPYDIFMNKNSTCELLCVKQLKMKQLETFKWMINHEYRSNWVIDNLPSAWRQTFYNNDIGGRITHYEQGFPVGWWEHDTKVDDTIKSAFVKMQRKNYYVYNHFKIVLKIHNTGMHDDNDDSSPPTTWRIVGFQVEPYSL